MVSDELVFMRDLAVVMVVAAGTTLLFHRLRQPVVLGYIIAGVIIGPFTLPYALVEDQDAIEILGQLGIVFLLFALGLEFNLKKLRKVGMTAVVAGLLEIPLMIWIGYVAGRAFGLPPVESLFLGAIISISSTVIIVKLVTDKGEQDEKWAQIVFGILIIEDIVAVFLLTFLPSVAGVGAATLEAVGLSLFKLGLFVATALVLGLLIVPRLVTYVAGLRMGDVLVVVVLALALGLALVGVQLGFSVALGAFIMGAIISESSAAKTVEERVMPIRDMFTAIFFVTVGMLIDPRAIIAHWPLVVMVAAAVIVGKILSVSFGVFLSGHEPRTALRAGFGLAQIGEFSFIIAALGASLGVTGAPLFEVAVTVSAITAFTAPLLVRGGPSVVDVLSRRAPRALVTYASLYDTWVRRLRTIGTTERVRAEAIHDLVRMGAFAAIVLVIPIVGATVLEVIGDSLLELIPVSKGLADVVAWTVIGMLTLPFLYLFMTALRQLATFLADEALPSRYKGTQQAAVVRPVLWWTFMLAGTVGLGVLALAIVSPIMPTLPIILVVVAAVSVTGALTYRALATFQTRVDESLSKALALDPSTPRTVSEEAVLDGIRESYPWGIEVRGISIPLESRSVGRTIKELEVRTETGATIVGIRRGSQFITNPGSETGIAPLDQVYLVGEPQYLSKAEALLLEGPTTPIEPPEGPSVGKLEVRGDSPCVGLTLSSLHMEERTGASIIGLVRGELHMARPDPDIGLESGDVLLVMGTTPTLVRAEELVCGDRAMAKRRDDP